MKTKILKGILFTFALMFSLQAKAQAEIVTITPTLPDLFADRICPRPIWQGKSYVWLGVKDVRESPLLGYQQKKGQTILEVVANPSLEVVMSKSLERLFTVCGMNLTTKNDDPEKATLSVEIEEFQMELEKKLLTGKAMAKSRITIIMDHPGHSIKTNEVGFEMENKKMRSKNIKQLEEGIRELLFETLNQITKARLE